MQFSREDLLTPNNILADALVELNDEGMKLFTPGHYTSLIQQALQELSIDTKFYEIVKDFPFPADTLQLPYPKNCFNLLRIYIYSGQNCNVEEMRNVYWKRDYITTGKDAGYTADVHTNTTDPFNNYYGVGVDSNIFYFNVQNGIIMFSSSCSQYQRVRLVFNGSFVELGDAPVVPALVRQAVAGYVVEKCYERMQSRQPQLYGALWQRKFQVMYAEYTGLWYVAKQRLMKIDDKLMRDTKEYLSKANE